MIVIQPVGRLGNHMFQFAFGYSMSKKLKTNFIFNTSLLEEYFELGSYNNPIKKRVRNLRYKFSLKFNKYSAIDLNRFIHPEEIMEEVKDNQIIYGYFQSEIFFKECSEEIRKLFTLKKERTNHIAIKYGNNFLKESVCVTVRLTDYISWRIKELNDVTPELSFHYFKKALGQIPDLDEKLLILGSDDVPTIQKKFGRNEHTIFIEDPFEQLYCLQHAKHIIISNSTFQWWGAWLNQRKDKVVYAPKYWLGHKVKIEYPAKIIPDDWIQIEVD